MAADHLHHLRLDLLDILVLAERGEILAAEVRGQDDDRVGEVDRAALAVGQPAVVEHLQQDVEDVAVGFLDLVEQHHLVGPPPHRLGQHAAFLIADIARRRADQPRDRVLLHELATCRCGPSRADRRTGIRRAPWSARSCRRRSGRGTGRSRAAGWGPAARRGRGAPRPATALTASSWPITRAPIASSMWSNFSRSPSIIRSTGIPVQRLTTRGDVLVGDFLAQHRALGLLARPRRAASRARGCGRIAARRPWRDRRCAAPARARSAPRRAAP